MKIKEEDKIDPSKTHGGRRANAGPKKGGSGGKRIGAGRKRGTKNVKTLFKEEAIREEEAKNRLKMEILKAMPIKLQRSEKALKEAIKELNEDEIEETFKKRIALHSNKLLTALLSAALGESYLYKIETVLDKQNRAIQKHIQVTDPEEIQMYLDNPLETEGETYFYIAKKAPDTTAINSLLDRMMGRPTTKVVGAKNPDGSEGPIRVVSVNYSLPAPAVAESTTPIHKSLPTPAEQIAEQVIHEAIEDK